jgi:hypothetical protein
MTNAVLTDDTLTEALAAVQALCTYMAVGTGSTEADESDTALVAEVARNPITSSLVGNELMLQAFFTNAQANAALRELGALDAGSLGNLRVRGVLPDALDKTSQKALITTIRVVAENAP